MANEKQRHQQPPELNRIRTSTSARRLGRIRTRSQSRSRNTLERVLSSQFPDDNSVYYHDGDGDEDEDGDDNENENENEHGNGGDVTESSDSKASRTAEKKHSSRSRGEGGEDDVILDDSASTSEEEKLEDDKSSIASPTIEGIRGGVPYEEDIEQQAPRLQNRKSARSARSLRDPNLVTWTSPSDPSNPKNWSMRRKWAAVGLVSCFTLVSPISSSMISPALASISAEFGITEQVQAQLTLSIFVLAYAIGPLFLGPLSEVYGRVVVLQLSNLFYLAFNIGCGFAGTKEQLMVFRFFSGLGGSAPLAIGGGVLSDCFHAEQRGRAISIYSLMPLLGPAIGPIAGGFISQNTTWRWCFYSTSIFTACVQIVGYFTLQETYAPKLLAWRRDRLRKETGNQDLHTEYDRPDKTLSHILKTAMQRPFIFLGTQPIIQCLACYMAYLYGLMYLMLSTFPLLWVERYGMAPGIGSLNFISMGLGFFLGTQITAPLNDMLYLRLKARSGGIGRPEFRVPIMVPASLLVPVGLFLYGWSAQAQTHWIVPNIGACIFCAGTIVGFQCIQTYLVDAYTRYAASAIAAATVLRSLAGFGFPLFAPAMFERLDFGWGNSVLGFLAVGLGLPGPFMLWKFGERLRGKSRYAAG